jgi:Mg-chelatase subunit ChlD
VHREDDTGRPRRAKPKVLDAPPSIYRGGTTPGDVLQAGDDDGAGSGQPPATKPGVTFTAEQARTKPLHEVLTDRRVDPRLQRDMHALAAQLALRRRQGTDERRGRARPASARFDGSADEIDLDRMLDTLAEGRPLRSDEFYVRRPLRARRSVALLADVSGSMTGDKARIAAAAIGALAGELADDELTVIAFWKDIALLRVRASRLDPMALLDDLMRIEPRGLTNVHGAIEVATHELSQSALERRCIVVLSDCVHNAGPDPRGAARRAPTTHVLLERTGEHDAWLGERIARVGGGRFRSVIDARAVAPALNDLLG